MKKLLTILILMNFLFGSKGAAQSTTILPGIVLPQMTTAQRNALSATNGMLIFDTNIQSYWLRSSGVWTELPKTAANTNFWQQTGLGGNEIKNTNSGGFWSANPTGLEQNSTDITNPPIAPASGAGTRMMWIPSRSAFRAGTVSSGYSTRWDATNIGLFSTATGYATSASGQYSTAMGHTTSASGISSTAMGKYTSASGYYSTAMGYGTVASGNNSTAMGNSTTASGQYSTAIGQNNVDNPNGLFMVGNGLADWDLKTVFIITKDNSRVGIGTETPLAPLHVTGQSTISGGISGRLFNFGTNSLFDYTGNEYPSIIADAAIISQTTVGAFQKITSSDSRIKNIIGLSDNVQDLAKLKKLEITDYRMKDVATWGTQSFKKVIAQQVEKVYPEAVQKQKQVIPDIYALSEKVSYDAATKELKCLLSKSYDLKTGDKIELVHPEKGKVQAVVASVSGNEFTVKDWLYATDKIFVFGREVSDFRTVDYDALSMLGISAIQQLAKENEELKHRLDKLETLEKRLTILEANSSSSKKTIN